MNEIVILLTFNCNLRCKYCLYEKTKIDITSSQITEILKWFISQKGAVKKIAFLGGEPLMSFSIIEQLPDILTHINPLNKKIYFKDIHTNGTLLNKKMLMFFKKNGMTLVFSLDGYSYESNRNRFNGNKKLFQQSIKNLKLYQKIIGQPKIKMTITPDEAENLYKNVKDLVKAGLKHIEIAPAFSSPWTEDTADSFLINFTQVIKFYKKLKNNGKDILIYPIDIYLEQIASGNTELLKCEVGERIVFTPAGDAFACPLAMHMKEEIRSHYYLGNVNTNIDLQKMNKIKNDVSCSDTETCTCRLFTSTSSESRVNFASSHAYELTQENINNEMRIEREIFESVSELHKNT